MLFPICSKNIDANLIILLCAEFNGLAKLSTTILHAAEWLPSGSVHMLITESLFIG